VKAALIQINKVSPLNLRKILSIDPGIDVKGSSVFLQSYCNLHESGVDGPLEEDGPYLFSTLMSGSIRNGNMIAWSSHYFNYVGVDGSILTPSTPDLIGTSNVVKAICNYSRLRGIDVRDTIEKYYNFLLCNFDHDHACYFYGHHVKDKYVPNCDAEVISSIHSAREIAKNSDVDELCRTSLRKMIDSQEEDGSWFYSYYHDGHVYRQLDFHQGYIIDGLIDALDLFPEMAKGISGSLEKATMFYDSMFTKDGRGYYRFPRQYPTDIHNQAQGIITYVKLYNTFNDKRYLDMSTRICNWTIRSMQDGNGYFYYQKGRLLVNKIPYMRWSQAWMMLALSYIIEFAKE
jgi:hypothetical protein